MHENMALYIEFQLKKLAHFTSTPGLGVSRLPFTKEAADCAEYIKEIMQEVGLEVHIDGSGGVIGRLEGKGKKIVMCGSHYDSVMYGGEFDGIAGVVCGIAAAKYFHDNNIVPENTIEIIALNDEEGVRFKGGYHTSKALLGIGDIHSMYTVKDINGITLIDAMEEAGYSLEDYLNCKRNLDEIKAFLEVHVEQGPILQNRHVQIGIVDNIVGIRRYITDIHGRTDHAGTTPMNMRIDAMAAAAAIIAQVGDIARRYPGSVATVAYMNTFPNEINTIANRVQFGIDIRSSSEEIIDRISAEFMQLVDRVCRKHGTTFHLNPTLAVEPVDMNKEIGRVIEKSCVENGYKYEHINSGAGHDSLIIGEYIDTAMIFVPSVGGRSHCKEEYSKYTDLEKATNVLIDTMQNI